MTSASRRPRRPRPGRARARRPRAMPPGGVGDHPGRSRRDGCRRRRARWRLRRGPRRRTRPVSDAPAVACCSASRWSGCVLAGRRRSRGPTASPRADGTAAGPPSSGADMPHAPRQPRRPRPARDRRLRRGRRDRARARRRARPGRRLRRLRRPPPRPAGDRRGPARPAGPGPHPRLPPDARAGRLAPPAGLAPSPRPARGPEVRLRGSPGHRARHPGPRRASSSRARSASPSRRRRRHRGSAAAASGRGAGRDGRVDAPSRDQAPDGTRESAAAASMAPAELAGSGHAAAATARRPVRSPSPGGDIAGTDAGVRRPRDDRRGLRGERRRRVPGAQAARVSAADRPPAPAPPAGDALAPLASLAALLLVAGVVLGGLRLVARRVGLTRSPQSRSGSRTRKVAPMPRHAVALGRDRPAVGLGEVADDRQPKAAARRCRRAAGSGRTRAAGRPAGSPRRCRGRSAPRRHRRARTSTSTRPPGGVWRSALATRFVTISR